MEHRLYRKISFQMGVDEVFAFFSDARNLERITPPELRFHIVSPLPIEMKANQEIDYSLALFGIPFSWKTLITCWEPGVRFVDQQQRGPYRKWHHTHTFTQEGDVTIMEDEVIYSLPCYPIGQIVFPLVRSEVEKIFDYRAKKVREILGK